MNIFKKYFIKTKKEEKPEDLTEISRAVAPLIDKTANDVFVSHCSELLEKPITYIIPAVWGKNVNDELTPTQVKINEIVAPVVDKVIRLFEFKDLNKEQQFAFEYLLRGLFISKITFMIELKKNLDLKSIGHGNNSDEILSMTKPIGNA